MRLCNEQFFVYDFGNKVLRVGKMRYISWYLAVSDDCQLQRANVSIFS